MFTPRRLFSKSLPDLRLGTVTGREAGRDLMLMVEPMVNFFGVLPYWAEEGADSAPEHGSVTQAKNRAYLYDATTSVVSVARSSSARY